VPPDRDLAGYLLGLILPCLTLGMGFASLIARVTRASMLDVLSQDFVRTAKAKGADRARILYAHALKNASIPIVTIVGLGFAGLIGGAVITESIFAIPGLGRLTLEAITHRDYPVIQGLVLVFSAGYVLVNLVVDLIYVLLDPRIRY
jgi:peptide/nickel transport system permease protein